MTDRPETTGNATMSDLAAGQIVGRCVTRRPIPVVARLCLGSDHSFDLAEPDRLRSRPWLAGHDHAPIVAGKAAALLGLALGPHQYPSAERAP